MAASSSRRPQSLAESRDASDSAIVPLAVRPAFGTAGKRIPVTANCCKINIDRNAWGQHVYRYYVEMYINGTRYMKPAILRRIFWDVVDNNRSLFPAFGIVFNDKDQLWSNRKFKQFEFEAQFGANNDHTIKLKLVDMFDFQIAPTSDQIQAEFLNSLLTQTDRCKLFPNSVNFFVQRDRLFFIPTEGSRPGADDLGRGLQMWYALHSLVSVGEKAEAIVNYDRTCAVFLKMRIPIIDYFLSVVSRRPRLTDADYRGLENFHWNPDQITALRESLKGLTMVTTYGGTSYYHYKFLDVYRGNASETMFNWRRPENNEEEEITIQEYYFKKWGIRLRLPHFPLIQAAPLQKNIYLPMELLMISDRPQRFQKPIPEDCMRAALEKATISPRDRFDLICDMIQQSSINDDNRFMQKFGVYVDTTLMITEARVLPLPILTVRDGHTVIRPDTTATWRSREVQSNSRRRAIIAVIINSEVRSSMGNSFFPYFNALMRACRSIGINLVDQQDSFQPVIHTYNRDQQEIDVAVTLLWERVCRVYWHDMDNSNVLFLYVGKEKNDYDYGNLKAKCDLELQEWNGRPVQIITQVVLEKTFQKMQNIQRPQDITATAKNVAYKINVKLGGVTTAALSSEEHPHWPTFTNPQEPTLFIGVDVAYCKIEGEVSWFAVTGSINLEATRYQTTITPMTTIAGYGDQSVNLRAAIQTSLKEFYKGTGGLYPSHIIMYRLGCTSSQMTAAAKNELRAVFSAVKEMAELANQGHFDPTITYLHIERKHQKRFHCGADVGNLPNGFAKANNGNVPAGTIVDRDVTSQAFYDFYLCSHHGALGTSRPTRYIVFYDDWNLTADQIQAATFCLCFLNSNCTKAISLPAPAYYASKGVERGKKYLNTCMLRREDIQPNEPLMMPKSISNSMYII